MIFMIFCKRIIRISIPKNDERTAGQMRKSFFLLLTTVYLILMSLLAAVSAQTPDGSIKIFVDGNEISSGLLPVISNSRTLVPVRPVAESCGISVSWNSETGGITLSKDVLSVSITVGSCEMKVYNSVIDEMKTVTLEQAP
ncbi:MAG: copper amine oxidase N-terminal domain-containing protein, partial [Ruminococcaceae bacterium]|nr:copper amine oxidase N-terminal domain-containing protein [Oscillospiraceae bacterium]